MKKVRFGEKEYIEIPPEMKGKKLVIIRVEEGVYIVGVEERVGKLLTQQIKYLAQRRRSQQAPKQYWVFDSEQEVIEFSRKHGEEIQRGEILGVRSFDGKFYAVRRDTYYHLLSKLKRILVKPKTVEEIAEEMGEPRNLVKAVLEIAREEGLFIERGGGKYEYTG